jgi:hypothetical protein
MSRIVLYPTAVYRTARDRAHEVCRPLAREVLQGARHLAPQGSGLHGSGRTDTRAKIRNSFGIRGSETRGYVIYEVYNTADHAATVAVGSRPHAIRAKPGKLLAFQSERFSFQRRLRGRSARALFFARKVNHPGNKRPVRYLQTPLAQFGRKRGFKVETVLNNRTRLP